MLRRSVTARSIAWSAVLAGGVGLGACVSAARTGPPLADPAAEAERLRAGTGAEVPARIRFRWEYGDEQGQLRGDGVARINPPDSFRLDLFTSGEGSMSVALAADSLATLGRIEDVELPTPPFLYGMAGVFRPGAADPVDGYRTEAGSVLVYEAADGRRRAFTVDDGRLVRVEERVDGRVTQRIVVSWTGSGRWPGRAEYRDLERPRRVEWHLEEEVPEERRFPTEIFQLAPDG